MRFGRFWLGALALCLLTGSLTGCSKREDMKLAEFKGKSISVGEFEEAYVKVQPEYLPKKTGEEGLREFLDTMLNKEIMVAKADELGYDKDPAVAQGVEMFSRQTMQVAYLKKAVADKVVVSEEEVRAHYNNQGVVLTIKQILTDTAEDAATAHSALDGGLDFDSACRQYSKSEDAAEGGLVLTVTYGALIPDIQTPLFATPVGKYTEPILTAHGWVIMKVLKRDEPQKLRPFEDVEEQMTTDYKRLKESVLVNEFTEKVRSDYGVTWHYDAMAIAFAALPPDRPFEEAPSRSQEVYPLLYFDPADLNRPLVEYQGKSITIKDFSDMYDQASFYTRPRKNFRLGGIRGFLTMPIMNEIVPDMVRKSGIENDPEVAAVLKSKREEIMLGLMYEEQVSRQTVVTSEMMQNYYNDNIEAFRVAEKRKFGLVLAGDVDAAQAAHRELKAGTSLATVATAYSTDEESRNNGGLTKDLARGENQEIDAVGFAMKYVGDVCEPFQTSRGWMVLKLVERTNERIFTYEEAQPRIEATLKEKLNEDRLNELLVKWKEEMGLVINDKNISKIQVTERSAADAPKGHAGHSHGS